MSNEASGNIVVSGEPNDVYDFIKRNSTLPDGYQPWENDGYYAISWFNLYHDFCPEFWVAASKEYLTLKFIVKYQLGLASAHRHVVERGNIAENAVFDWETGGVHRWV
jgi:hypothetical protein